ncbi:Protein CBG01159 [Caenorhabditis briggsae]|uniref:Protein CBG01159 n=1 Tax=Caenorhabditis briggsae TaxID=6238 RepID=A8WPQ1_CAEBR|nr:Protein CBG01159 [Caenorhabditis briggsae]CAP22458.1 Protein CBG01159 [Caenorhabditis briggsae]
MSENPQNIKCGWTECTHRFGTEIDMNMHVLMNHMILLEHGNFTLHRKEKTRKRVREAVESQSSLKTEPVSPERSPPSQTRRIPDAMSTPSAIPQFSRTLSRVINIPSTSESNRIATELERILENMNMPVPPLQNIPMIQNPLIQNQMAFQNFPPMINDDDSDDVSLQNADDQADAQDICLIMGNPPKLSDVIEEFLERLRPMKQLGFIRPQRSVYCLVCLKYVKSFHECNWKHTFSEERIAEMWYRRFGKSRPNGKHQLMKELLEIKELILSEEAKEEQDAEGNNQ